MKKHRVRVEKVRRRMRKVDCYDCDSSAGEPCVDKTNGTYVRGVHKSRKLLAYSEGMVIYTGESSNFPWDVPENMEANI